MHTLVLYTHSICWMKIAFVFLNDRRLTHVLCQCAGHGIVQIDASMAVSMSNVSEIYTEKGNDMRRVRQRQKRHKDKHKYMYLYSCTV